MILFITGTPGTGKSTVSKLLSEELSATLIDLNQLVEDQGLYTCIHPEMGHKIVDLDTLCYRIEEKIKDFNDREDAVAIGEEDLVSKDKGHLALKDKEELMIVEGHLSHFCWGADLVIVLRAHPSILKGRLQDKGFGSAKIQENIEAEALDVCAFEAFQIHGERVNEIDTSGKSPQEMVDLIVKVINGDKHFPVGKADFLDYLHPE